MSINGHADRQTDIVIQSNSETRGIMELGIY